MKRVLSSEDKSKKKYTERLTHLCSSFQHRIGAFKSDVELVLQARCNGRSGKTLKLGRCFVAEKEGDSTEIISILAFASNLNHVVFEEDPAVFRDEFEEVFLFFSRFW